MLHSIFIINFHDLTISLPYNALPNIFFREKLRKGAIGLLRTLQSEGHDIWIYTTSLRDERYVKKRFWFLGIHIGEVINQKKHFNKMRSVNRLFKNSSKYPPVFGIDLLIDDLEGVAMEGRKYGFNVLQINPDDERWMDTVLELIRQKQANKKNCLQ